MQLNVKDTTAACSIIALLISLFFIIPSYQSGNTPVFFAGISVFSGLLLIGYNLISTIADRTTLERLASFPENNPHPVIMMSSAGLLLYANRSANVLAGEIDKKSRQIESILPTDIGKKLQSLRNASTPEVCWEYPANELVIECTAHYLPEQALFHLYLADITKRKKTEQELVECAYLDTLTGLPNRSAFHQRATQMDQPMALFLIGVDRFKSVTGSLGHDIGNKLLKAVTMRLQEALKIGCESTVPNDLFRFEGDVFALIMTGVQKNSLLDQFAQLIMEAMQKPFYVQPRQFFLTVSCGISKASRKNIDKASLIRDADIAMHQAKLKGGNTFILYRSEMNTESVESLSLENYLRHAIHHDELELYYQPQIEVDTEKVIGMEALLRWQHPDYGLMTPDKFIPIAEETGIVNLISEWILRTACRQTKTWQSQGLGKLIVAINISTRQFLQPDLQIMVERVLSETDLDAQYLELEITENIAVQDLDKTQTILNGLKQIGIRLSIDDFGTGYSSLSYIKHFPVDKLKIDQSFIHDIVSDSYDAAITRAIIALGRSLDLTIVAEGVETSDQFDWLKNEGCNQIQGYIFSKPIAKTEFESFLRTNLNTNGEFRI